MPPEAVTIPTPEAEATVVHNRNLLHGTLGAVAGGVGTTALILMSRSENVVEFMSALTVMMGGDTFTVACFIDAAQERLHRRRSPSPSSRSKAC